MRVAVAGGTGLVGRLIVEALTDLGDDAAVLARATGVDITTGAGLDKALTGVETVIDASNVTTTNKKEAVAFFGAGTSQLLAAGARAGVRHHIVLSIVGVDRVDFGYYLGKRHQEELALGSGRPVSVLRTTQFHEFAGQLLDRSRGPIAIVPQMRVQPVAAREVADALVALAHREPGGMAPELAGPEPLRLLDLARAVLTSRRSSRRAIGVRLPGAVGRAMAGGALLPQSDGPRGRQIFNDWLTTPAPALR